MTSDLSVVRGQWQVASKGIARFVLREAAMKSQRNERQRNGGPFSGCLRVFAAICASHEKNPECQESARDCQLGRRDRDIASHLCGGFSVPLESNADGNAVLVMQVVGFPQTAKIRVQNCPNFRHLPPFSACARGRGANAECGAVRTGKANSGGRKFGNARYRPLKKARKFAIARIRSILSEGHGR